MFSSLTPLSLTLLSVFLLPMSCVGQIPDNVSGYVDVRPSAHMFWWLYGSTHPTIPREQLPLVMWLQVGNSVNILVCSLFVLDLEFTTSHATLIFSAQLTCRLVPIVLVWSALFYGALGCVYIP